MIAIFPIAISREGHTQGIGHLPLGKAQVMANFLDVKVWHIYLPFHPRARGTPGEQAEDDWTNELSSSRAWDP